MLAYAHDAGRLAIAVTLLIAGAAKLFSPRPLATVLGQVYGWARPAGARVARAVSVLELTAAFLLAGGWAVTAGLALTGLAGAGVAGFTAIAMRRGATAPCGCFGESSGRPIGLRNLLAGVALLVGAIGLLALPGAGTAEPALLLPLTAVAALAAVMLRDRARLLAPFRRHFQAFPTGPEVS